MEQRDTVEKFIANLKSDTPFLRMSAADILGVMRANSAVEALISAIFDEDFAVQMEAVKALGKIGKPKAIKPLENLISGLGNNTEDNLLLAKTARTAIKLIQQMN